MRSLPRKAHSPDKPSRGTTLSSRPLATKKRVRTDRGLPRYVAHAACGRDDLGAAHHELETVTVSLAFTLRPLLSVTWIVTGYVPALLYVCVPRTLKVRCPAMVTVVLAVV